MATTLPPPTAGASAVIVRTSLPRGLERLRRSCVADSVKGVPAHLTLLYPFVDPGRLSRSVRARIAAVASGHAPFGYRLSHAARWPDTIYVAVEPASPFTALQGDLQAAYPEHPIYDGRITEFVPHVTVAEGACVDQPGLDRVPAWSALPQRRAVNDIEVIASGGDGRWRLVWRIPLGGPDRGVGRMRP